METGQFSLNAEYLWNVLIIEYSLHYYGRGVKLAWLPQAGDSWPSAEVERRGRQGGWQWLLQLSLSPVTMSQMGSVPQILAAGSALTCPSPRFPSLLAALWATWYGFMGWIQSRSHKTDIPALVSQEHRGRTLRHLVTELEFIPPAPDFCQRLPHLVLLQVGIWEATDR